MAVSNCNNILFTALSALNGRTLSTLSAIDGFAITATPPGPPTSSLWAWYEPSRETGLSDGDAFSPLTDQGGNGRNFTQATAGDRPKYDTTDALNGLAVAKFDSDSRWWDGPDMSANGQGTGSTKQGHVFIVVKGPTVVDANNTGLWQMSTAGSASHFPFTNGLIYEACIKGSREDAITPGVALTNWNVYECEMQASSSVGNNDGFWYLRINGTQIFFGNIVGAGWTSTPTLGRNFNGQVFNNGFMAGLYLYSTRLTGATNPTRAQVISYINTRFALSSS